MDLQCTYINAFVIYTGDNCFDDERGVEEHNCFDDEPEVEEHEFDAVLGNVAADEFCSIVESEFTPFVRQRFNNIGEAIKFYKMYALSCGFDVRKTTTKKWDDGTIKSKLLVCNREGETYYKKASKKKDVVVADVQEGDNSEHKQLRNTKVRRIGCKARLRLYMFKGVLVVDRFHAGHNHELIDIKDREFQKLSRKLHKYHKQLIVSNSRVSTLHLTFNKFYSTCQKKKILWSFTCIEGEFHHKCLEKIQKCLEWSSSLCVVQCQSH